MIGHIIDIEYDDGTVNIAKIIDDIDNEYVVKELVSDAGMFRFSRFSRTVPKESVSGFYDTTDLTETGLFAEIENGYYETLDSEYEYETDSESDTDVSLDDEED